MWITSSVRSRATWRYSCVTQCILVCTAAQQLMGDTFKLEQWSVMMTHFYRQANLPAAKLVEVDLKILLGFVHQLGQLRNTWIDIVGKGLGLDWTVGIVKESDVKDLAENMMLVEELYSKCQLIEEYLRKTYSLLTQVFQLRTAAECLPVLLSAPEGLDPRRGHPRLHHVCLLRGTLR